MKNLKLFGREVEFDRGKSSIESSGSNPRSLEIWPFFLIVTFFLCLSVNDAYDSWKGTMTIPVVSLVHQFSAHQEFTLPGNNTFVSGGGTGSLVWHPQSFVQALALKMADNTNFSFMDIFHVGLLYVFVLIFYFMTRNGKGKMVFSKRVSLGFRIIFFLITITGSLEYGKYKFLNQYVEHITNSQFRLPPATIQWYYFYLGMMLIVLTRFTDRASELQKEAELTI